MNMLRGTVAVIAALVVAALSVRNAEVQAWSESVPRKAHAAWSRNPDAMLSLGMIEIAEVMRDRKRVPASVFGLIDDAAVRAPLASEPFLVHGVQAGLAGNSTAAQRNFEAAQRRDPRSLPAAYFLAEHYFRSGDSRRGLKQVAILSRLAPGGRQSVAPYLAAYATNRANWPELRALFRAEPTLADATLQALATEASNAPVIVGLADARQRDAKAGWVGILLPRLVAAGEYARARSIWAWVANVPVGPETLLYDPSFTKPNAPPPFNWDLASSTVGLAERRPGGALHAMFYGQDDGMMVRQLLVLAPGSYRLTMRVAAGATHPEAFFWVLRCAKGNQELDRVPLARTASGWTLTVPATCPAQWLELTAVSADLPQQSDVTIANLSLNRERHGA
ncbi:MAG: hypothetical protein ABIW33_09285 [Sphingomicrobium sp.]